MEFAFLAKSLYSKFEYTQQKNKAKRGFRLACPFIGDLFYPRIVINNETGIDTFYLPLKFQYQKRPESSKVYSFLFFGTKIARFLVSRVVRNHWTCQLGLNFT